VQKFKAHLDATLPALGKLFALDDQNFVRLAMLVMCGGVDSRRDRPLARFETPIRHKAFPSGEHHDFRNSSELIQVAFNKRHLPNPAIEPALWRAEAAISFRICRLEDAC